MSERAAPPITRLPRSRRPSVRSPWSWLVALLVAGVIAGGYVLAFSSVLDVRNVQIVGAEHLNAAQLEAVADIPTGTPLARVDLSAVEGRLGAVPGVAAVTASRAWPHTVEIHVAESRPVAVVRDGGQFGGLDAAGRVFRTLPRAPARLPLVRTDELSTDQRALALAEVAEVVTSLTPELARRVGDVEVTSMDSIVLLLRDGDRVQWGSADDSARKAQVMDALLRIPAGTYDVSVPDFPTTRGGT